MTTSSTTLTRERADLIESLRRHRGFLRFTVRDLTEEQARVRPTVSALYLGGLIKHVAATEASWARFAEGDVGDGDVEVDLVDGRDGRAHGDLLGMASSGPTLGRRYDGIGAPM